MKKKTSLLIILLLIVILLGILNLFWISDMKQSNSEFIESSYKPTIKGQTVRSIHMTQHEGRLYPETIVANKGELLVVSFVDKNVTSLEIPDYEFMQNVKNYNFNLVLDKEGRFEIYCHTCPEKSPVVLIVN